jgi:tetratricopeptide (TPR) repeat protein
MLLSTLNIVMLATFMNPDQLFGALNDLKALNKRSPHKAITYYQNIVPQIPTLPSKGSMLLHLAGMDAAIKTKNASMVNTTLQITSQQNWLSSIEHGEYKVFVKMAIYHRKIRDYNYAEYLNSCALSWAVSEQQLNKVVNNLSVIYRYTEQYSKAIELLEKKLIKVNSKTLKAKMYNNLGNFYQLMNRYNEAGAVYKKSFLIHSINDYPLMSSTVGLNLLQAMILTENWSEFSRFIPAINQSVAKTEHQDLIQYLYWQRMVFNVKYHGNILTPAQEKRLIQSMPLLHTPDISASITDYVNILNIDTLSSEWRTIIKRPFNLKVEKVNKRLPVKIACNKDTHQSILH